jgi:uncharacterized membrane protein YozB (DUF420 family)
MYSFILATHNIVRWLILVAAVVAIVQAFAGWFGKKEWSKADNLTGIIYVSVVDLNVLLGLILYLFLSPLTRQAFADFGAAMGNPTLRFFAVEHIFTMLVALALAHIGRSLSKKATETTKKHRTAAIWYTVSLLAILTMIPWDRALWPSLG